MGRWGKRACEHTYTHTHAHAHTHTVRTQVLGLVGVHKEQLSRQGTTDAAVMAEHLHRAGISHDRAPSESWDQS